MPVYNLHHNYDMLASDHEYDDIVVKLRPIVTLIPHSILLQYPFRIWVQEGLDYNVNQYLFDIITQVVMTQTGYWYQGLRECLPG